jgi:carbamoyl-phosphate synthase large subunit
VIGSELRAGPRAIRSLKQAGYRVLGAHTHDFLGGRSLACPRPLRHPRLGGDTAAFAAWLSATIARHRVDAVLGANEDAARFLARSGDALNGAVLVGPNREQYAALCDKWTLANMAEAAGVDHPATVLIGPDGLSGPLPFPAIIKPRESGEGIEQLTLKAEIVRTPAELQAILASLAEHGAEAIGQALISGPRWSAHGVSTSQGLVGVANRVVRDYPRGRGVTSIGEGIPLPPGLHLATERLCQAVDYRGGLSVNAIERDGRFFVHDVNLRLPAAIALSMAAGLDMPRLAVADALGLPIDDLPTTFTRSNYISIDLETTALVDSIRGRGRGVRPTAIVRTAARHLTGRGRADIDPHPLDPFWLPLVGARVVRRSARSAARRVLRIRPRRP